MLPLFGCYACVERDDREGINEACAVNNRTLFLFTFPDTLRLALVELVVELGLVVERAVLLHLGVVG